MELSFTDLIELVKDALNSVSNGNLPENIQYLLSWVILLLFSLFVIYVFVFLFAKIVSIVRDELLPLFYNVEKRRRLGRRQRFADQIEHEIRRLNSLEEWSDYRYTELEAEVEAEGTRHSKWVPFLMRRDQLRRESSLTNALRQSTERLILVEGTPGSGKSVALRHVALALAKDAMHSRTINSVIPIFVNLKSLRREDRNGSLLPIDQNLIRNFVLDVLNRANDRDIESFLE